MDDDAIAAWPAWRLWLEGKATMTELNQMSIDDVETANRWLDAFEVARIRAEKRGR